jgi:hypothetical protein
MELTGIELVLDGVDYWIIGPQKSSSQLERGVRAAVTLHSDETGV